MATHGPNQELASHLTLRRVVGVLGVLLPLLLVVGCFVLGAPTILQDSISDYYGTVMRNVFVGVLFTIGWFLFTYRGYERSDDIAGDIACASMLCVALFPITSESAAVRAVHLVSAGVLFLVLSYFSLVLFTKSQSARQAKEKQIRNWIYRFCGTLMLLCIAGIGIYYLALQTTAVSDIRPVFWLESIALWAFGWSWFVKGETLFRDAGSRSRRRAAPGAATS